MSGVSKVKAKLAVLLLAVAMICGVLGVALLRPVNAFQADSDTVTVHKGVDLTTFRDGRYDFRRPWLEANGADQTILDNENFFFFDGAKADFTKGWLYESGEELLTAQISLAKDHTGNFSLVGSSLQEQQFFGVDLGNDFYRSNRDYNQISFVFTDAADAENQIIVDIKQSGGWWATVSLSYGGKTVVTRDNKASGINEGDVNNGGYTPSYSFSDGIYGSKIVKPIMLEFSPADQSFTYDKWGIAEILNTPDPWFAENKKFHFDGQTDDPNDHLPAITGFESYNVDMVFSRTDQELLYRAFSKEEPAGSGNWIFDYAGNGGFKTQKFMLYEINGIRLDKGALTDETKPVINQVSDVKAQVGCSAYLPLYILATDNVDGNLLNAKYIIDGPNGEEVQVTPDNYFTPQTAGEYTVTCVATDTAGNETRGDFKIVAEEGPLWYKNVDLETFRGGRYKDFLPVVDTDGSGYGFTSDSSVSNYYSGGLIDPHSGLYVEACGGVQKISLGDKYTGNFSMIGAGIQENDIFNGTAGSLNKDYSIINLYFMDNLNKENVLKVSISQQQWTTVAVSAEYKGQAYGPFASRYSITTGNWPGSGGLDWQHRLMNVRVDFANGKIYSDCYSADNDSYCIDLSAGGVNPLSGFDQYSVDFEFENVGYQLYMEDINGTWTPVYDKNLAYQRVKYIFFELNGQSLAGETLTDTAAPMLYFAPENGQTGAEYDISAFVDGFDLIDKEDLTFSYEVKYNGSVVSNEKVFTPDKVGIYTIKVTCTDKAGKSVEAEKEITVSGVLTADMVSDIVAHKYTGQALTPEVTVDGLTADQFTVEYKNNINAGTATVVITAKAESGYSGTVEKTFVIEKADQSAPEESGFVVNFEEETYSVAAGIEVSASETFDSLLPSNGTVEPGKTYYIRKAGDENHNASTAVSIAVPERPAAPAAPVASEITSDSITIAPVEGVVFTIEGGSFTGLQADTEYVVTATIPATDSSFKSQSTATFRTKPVAVTEYDVTLTKTDGITFGGYESLKVAKGQSFTFTVTLGKDYDQSKITVKANGKVIAAGTDGKYTVENVTENITITVEGVVRNPVADNNNNTGLIIGISVAAVLVVAAGVTVVIVKKKNKSK